MLKVCSCGHAAFFERFVFGKRKPRESPIEVRCIHLQLHTHHIFFVFGIGRDVAEFAIDLIRIRSSGKDLGEVYLYFVWYLLVRAYDRT